MTAVPAVLLRWPSLSAALLSLLIFSLLSAPFDFTFMADDWVTLAAATPTGQLPDGYLGSNWARMPVWSALALLLFRPAVWQHGWWVMYLTYFVHALGFAVIARWVASQVDSSDVFAADRAGQPSDSLFVLLSCAVIALYPNHYQILYWPTCMPFVAGLGFTALALVNNKSIARALFLAAAFLTYETYVLPSLALLLFPALVAGAAEGRFSGVTLRLFGRALAVWASAVVVWQASRVGMGTLVGDYPYAVSFDPAHILQQMTGAARSMLTIRFTVFGRAVTVVQAVVVGSLLLAVAVAARPRGAHLRLALGSAVLLGGSTAAYWLLDYSAQRALYGSAILATALVVVVAGLCWRRARYRWLAGVCLAVLLLSYGVQSLQIFRVKDANAKILVAKERALVAKMRACVEPCIIDIGDLDAGLRPDWVLPPDYWSGFAALIKARHEPQRDIRFRIDGRRGTP